MAKRFVKKSYRAGRKIGRVKKNYRRRALKRPITGLASKVNPSYARMTKFSSGLPFPPIKNMKFHYTYMGTLNSVGSGSSLFGPSKTFQLNSLTAPEASGGHQPMGFDQICAAAAMYHRYKVNSVKVRISFSNPICSTAAALNSMWGGILINNPTNSDDITGDSISAISERPQGQVVKIPYQSGTNEAIIECYFPMNKLFNWTRLQFKADNSTTTGTYTGSPASMPTMTVAVVDNSAQVDVCYIRCKVDFTFYATMYARDILPQS